MGGAGGAGALGIIPHPERIVSVEGSCLLEYNLPGEYADSITWL